MKLRNTPASRCAILACAVGLSCCAGLKAAPGDFVDVFVAEGSGGLNGPGSFKFGPDGNLYVPSFFSGTVLVYDGATGGFLRQLVGPASGGPAILPEQVGFGPDGLLYVGSYADDSLGGEGAILRYDAATGDFIDVFVPDIRNPDSIVFGPDGYLYTTSDFVEIYDPLTGYFVDGLFAAGLESPEGVAFGPDGNLYVANYGGDEVLRFDTMTGRLIDSFVPPESGGLLRPDDLTFGPDGNLYVSSRSRGSVLRYDGTTGAFLDRYLRGGVATPEGLAFGPDGQLYIGGESADSIFRFEGPGRIGDTNGDRLVDIDDVNAVRNHFGATGADDGTLAGDAYPWDGLVNIDDLNAVRNNFGTGTAAVPEPEPGAGLLIFGAMAFLLTRRRAGQNQRMMEEAPCKGGAKTRRLNVP